MGLNTRDAAGDLINNALAGVIPGLLLLGALGVLVMTGEYGSGMIRSTLAAMPRRPLVLAAKAAVFGAVALAVGEAASLSRSSPARPRCATASPAPTLGDPACCGRSC